MKLLAISEHYFPRVGGTVNYVHETLCALADQGVDVELIVPGPAPAAMADQGLSLPYRLTWLDAAYPEKGDPTRQQRYSFCQQVNSEVGGRLKGDNKPSVVHVLFGLFVMEVLDTAKLRNAGVQTFATVHNVPPMECRVTAHNAALSARLKEDIRLFVVKAKNWVRLRKHAYDCYVVPSEQVAGFLRPIVKPPVAVIGHGPTSDLQSALNPPASRVPQQGKVRILTVAGYAPHKRQHIIPQVAARLLTRGIEFQWDVVGPSGRVAGYFNSIADTVNSSSLAGKVVLHHALPLDHLAQLYDSAHLYVQPSIEEGFCLTALDAAATGLPVIGCPAGALPTIVKASGGTLVESEIEPLAVAIMEFIHNNGWPNPDLMIKLVCEQFSWASAAKKLINVYQKYSTEIGNFAK